MSATARDEGSGENSRPLPRGDKASVKFRECYRARKTEKENFANKKKFAAAGGKCGKGKNARALPREGNVEREKIRERYRGRGGVGKGLIGFCERCRGARRRW